MEGYKFKRTSEEIDELLDSIENQTIYSTDEQIVGTWIDGRPVYRKCVKFTTPSTAIVNDKRFNVYTILVNNVDVLIDIKGYVEFSTYKLLLGDAWINYSLEPILAHRLSVDNGDVYLDIAGKSVDQIYAINKNGIAVIEYVKIDEN